MSDASNKAKKKRTRQQCLLVLATGALSTLMPAAFADYAECLGGPRQTDTLRNPLVPGAPSGHPGQIAYGGQPPAIGSGSCAPGVIPGDLGGPARVTSGYADSSHGSIFPAGGSQGGKLPYAYVPGAGRYPTKAGNQQGMYDYGQGQRGGSNTYEGGSENAGMGTYESGRELYGQRRYDFGQGMYGQQTYQSGAGNYGQKSYEYGGQANGVSTFEGGYGNGGMQRYETGGGNYGQQTYSGTSGNYGQKTYENGGEMSGSQTFDNGAGNGGIRRMDNGGGNSGSRMYDNGAGNGGTQYYSGKGRGGSVMYDNGQGNGGTKVNDGGAGNGGTKSNDFGTEASGNKIENEGGARQGGRGVVNNGGPRSSAQQTNDQLFSHSPQSNNYDFQGPLPTVRTFSRYLVILGVVVACIWVAMAGISVVMGNRNGPDRVVGAVAGLLLLLAGYTIWKVVQMNTFHANTTGVWSNTRGQAQPKQQNGPVNPPQAFAPPEDPGQTPAVPGPSANQQDSRQRSQQGYRPGPNQQDPRTRQGDHYRPQGPYTGHPQGPDRVGSYDIPAAGVVPEPPEQNVINPNK